MLALSCSDFIFSTALFVWNWPDPDSGWCTATGFFELLGGTPEAMLNAGLCVYYLFYIYCGWSEQKILPFQLVLIVFPIIWGLIGAILPLARGMINADAQTGHCWIFPTPSGCNGSECTPDKFYYHLYRFVLVFIPRWISFGVAVSSMCLVYFKVGKDEREHGGQAPAGWLWFVQREEGQDISRKMRSRRMARQAFWYLLNFFLTYAGITAMRIVQAFGGTVPFGLRCFAWIFLPWQGFWNAIIYMRPRYIRNREKYSDMSIWQAIITEDDYDARLGARAMRSTVAPSAPNFSGSFFGSVFHRASEQAEHVADVAGAADTDKAEPQESGQAEQEGAMDQETDGERMAAVEEDQDEKA